MREIKFRAWDKRLQRWSNPKDLTAPSEATREISRWEAQDGILSLKNHEDYVWMQYTGLKDKNGVEIYEGDVIRNVLFNPTIMQVAFIEGAFCLADSKGEYVADIHYIHHANRPTAVVIGNVHEDPELLASEGRN